MKDIEVRRLIRSENPETKQRWTKIKPGSKGCLFSFRLKLPCIPNISSLSVIRPGRMTPGVASIEDMHMINNRINGLEMLSLQVYIFPSTHQPEQTNLHLA